MFDWVNDVVEFLRASFLAMWQAVKTFFVDLLFAIFDGVLSVLSDLASAIPVPSSWSQGDVWGGLPSTFHFICSSLNIGTCFAIIAGAYGVRFLLNLIPGAFTRV